jgi:hypothetical protein
MCIEESESFSVSGRFPTIDYYESIVMNELIAAVGSTLISTTDFDVMTRASFFDRVITMQLESKYRRNLDFCQSVIARKSP